jgi:putative FmdB family regulatory protein
MPTYAFECKKCTKVWEEVAEYDKTGKYSKVSCPKCKSKSKNKLLTTCRFSFTNPVGTDVWNSESKGHDYRHNFNVDRPGGVRDQRKNAKENSHMGSEPYSPINDIDSDSSWGEIK